MLFFLITGLVCIFYKGLIDDLAKNLEDENFIVIQGNTDEMIANHLEIKKLIFDDSAPMLNALLSDVELLSDEQILFLKNYLNNLLKFYCHKKKSTIQSMD